MPNRACFLFVLLIVGQASCLEGGTHDEDGELEENPTEHRLNLLSMMEGVGAMAGIGPAKSGIIDVGLDWKYMSATAQKKMTTPKISVGHKGAMKALVHVETKDTKKAAFFTGSDNVDVEIRSRSKAPVLGLTSGKGRWDVSVPDASGFHIGKSGLKPTIRLADGKVGVATANAPKTSLHLQSNRKGDSILFQGNFDGKTDGLMDSTITLESSADFRGRGVFMPHRGAGNAGATAWFVGVPNGGGGFQIGSSPSQLTESSSGPYTKKKAHMFVSTEGKVAFGHTAPEGQVDIQLLAGNKKDANRALNIRSGSLNVDMDQGVNTGRVSLISGGKETIKVGSSTKNQEREIRLQTSEKKFVTVSRYNAYVGIGGVTNPSAPLDVKGTIKMSDGQFKVTMAPKAQEQLIVVNSQSTVPAAIGLRQADKPYMTISAGKAGATLEMANKASLTVAGGKMGVGTDPSELFHVKGGDALLDGKTNLWFKSKASGTRLYESNGLHVSGGLSGQIHLDNSDVLVSNPGSASKLKMISGPAKDAVVQLASGTESWKMHMSMAAQGSLFFSNKGVRVAMSRRGQLGVGIKIPKASLHVKGSTLLEHGSKPVFSHMKAASESQPAGVQLTSGSEQWKVQLTGSGSKRAGPGSLEFTHGLKTHVAITKTGTLGVGVAVPLPGTSLHVKGPSMFNVGKEKGKIVLSTPNGNPGMTFFDNKGFRRMDFEVHSTGASFTSAASFLGVGTKSPKSRLHVYDTKNTMITLSRSGKETSRAHIKYSSAYMKVGTANKDGVQLEVNNAPKLTVHPNGNVGIQSVVPQSQLQVGTSSHMYQASDITAVTGNAYFDGAKYKYTTAGGAAGVKMSKDGKLGLYTAATGSVNMEVSDFAKARLVVNNKGNVGIGTQTPDTSLHIGSTKAATLKSHGSLMIGAGKSKSNLVLDSRTVQARKNGRPSILRLNPFGGDVTMFGDSAKPGQKVVFTRKGNIGFGTAKPQAKLHVSEGPGRFSTIGIGESKAGVAVIRFKGSVMTLGFSKSSSGATNKEDAIVIQKGGNVGIGSASPKSKLHVVGNVDISGKLNVGGKQIVTMLEDVMKENSRLSMELAATKEMLMSMSANMRKLSMEATRSEA